MRGVARVALLAAAALAFVLPARAGSAWPLASAACRALAALGWMALDFASFRRRERPGRGARLLTAAAAALLALSLCDAGLWAKLRLRPAENPEKGARYFGEDFDLVRSDYRPEELSAKDLVLIGDSFVFGQGVKRTERFGAVLDPLWRAAHGGGRVVNLGIPGAGLPDYVRYAQSLPLDRKAGRLVLAYCHNDMPAPASAPRRLLAALGRASLSFELLSEAQDDLFHAGVARYERDLAESYDPRGPDFQARWRELQEGLDRFAAVARTRSLETPVFLILPVLSGWSPYRFEEADDRLRQAAEGAGFLVYDPAAEFRVRVPQPDRGRASPNDVHYNPELHAFLAGGIARFLKQAETGPPADCVKSFKMEDVLRRARREGAAFPEPLARALLGYYQYRAFAARDPRICAALKGLFFSRDDPSPVDAAFVCRDEYYEMRHVQSLMTGSSDFAVTCRESMINTSARFTPEYMDRICGIVRRHFPDARALCGELNPAYPEQAATCVELYSETAGDGSGCRGTRRIQKCFAPYREASRKSDAALCGESENCLAFMGLGGDVSLRFVREARDFACRPARGDASAR